MKNLTTTQKIFVILGVILLIYLIYTVVNNYNKTKKEQARERLDNRINQVIEEKKLMNEVSGDQLTSAIREKLSKQPVSEVGVKFYQS